MEEKDIYWNSAMGSSYAGIEIVVDSIKRAGCLKKENLRRAIANTDMTTIVGPVDFKDSPAPGRDVSPIVEEHKKHVSLQPMVAQQWVPSEKWDIRVEIVNNGRWDKIPETSDLLFPYPMEQGKF